jgi:hypothetical protein
MTELVKRLLSIATPADLPASKGELIVMPTIESRVGNIRKAHDECLQALTDSLRAAIVAGKELIVLKAELKKQKPSPLWEDYVPLECGLSVRTAQNYMHLAKHEASLAPFLSGNPQGSAFSQAQALKFLGEERKKRKRKPAK